MTGKKKRTRKVILEDFQRKIQTKDLQWNEADKKAAVAQSRIERTDETNPFCMRHGEPVPSEMKFRDRILRHEETSSFSR